MTDSKPPKLPDLPTSERIALAEAYRSLGQQGLIQGSSGNISLRTPTGMLISPTRTTPERVTPEALVATTLDAPEPGASSEWPLHAGLYRERPDLHAIIHTHADHCTALACLNEPIPAFHYLVLSFGGPDIRCAPYVTFGTPVLAELTVEAMQDRTACLLANHGMIAAGPSLAAALDGARLLETLARQYLLARAAGQPRLLTPSEIADALNRFKSY